MLFRTTFLAAASYALLAGAAAATPVVVDPNFNQTATATPYYYGIAGWGAAGLAPSSPAYNPSFAGNVGFDPNNQWNNGTPGNGQTKVGFLSNSGSYIFQEISGFTVGDSYSISVLANGRMASPDYPQSAPAALTITAGTVSYALYSGDITAVDLPSVQDTSFHLLTGLAFTANAATIMVRLTNTGTQDSTVLLSGFAITDLGVAVPEPVSLALFGTGMLGLALVRRRS